MWAPDRDRDSRDRDPRDSKYGFRNVGWGAEDRHRGNDAFFGLDRRGGGRVGGGGRYDGGYEHRGYKGRGYSENEPEWMSESVSITDVIELKGFEEGRGRNNTNNSRPNSRQSNRSERSHHSSGPGGGSGGGGVGGGPGQLRGGGVAQTTGLPGHIIHQLELQQHQDKKVADDAMPPPPQPPAKDYQEKSLNTDNSKVRQELFDEALVGEQQAAAAAPPVTMPPSSSDGFNFDQLFESSVNLNSLLDNLGSVAELQTEVKSSASQSRFSQFFSKPRSRRSSIQDELVADMLREMVAEPSIKIPSPEESTKYFTPISPAAKTEQG